MVTTLTRELPKELRILNPVRLSDSLVAKPEGRGLFLERHDGRGTYWGVVLTPEETAALAKTLSAKEGETCQVNICQKCGSESILCSYH